MTTVSSVATTTSTSTASTSSSLTLDMNQFLQILVTQLKTQNPLEPTDVTDFTNQLVGYAQLGQQTETNDNLAALSSSLTAMLTAGGADYIGKTAEIDSTDAPVQNGSASWTYTVDSDAASTALVVTNQDGDVVWSGTGETTSGQHAFSLDQADLTGVEDGDVLTLTSVSSDADGAGTVNGVTAFAKIDAVTFDSGTTAYQAGDAVISADDILKLYASA
jgi:flagellar basal-body rod modification protein FlgD